MKHSFPSSLRSAGSSFLLLALALAVFGSAPSQARADEAAPTVVHLSKYGNDLHAVFMALKVAGMLREKGEEVSLFVDLEGARLADRRVPADMKWGQSDATVAELLESFVADGGVVRVCPHCARAAGLDEANLRDGATILSTEELAELLAGAGKVIDY